MLRYAHLRKKARELSALERDTTSLQDIEAPFPKITYDEAVEILKKKGMKVQYGSDFGAPAETSLSNEFKRPVFVMNYPLSAKEFYMKEHPENPELVLCFDVLAPEGFGEIVGGSQRVDDVKTLEQRLKDFNLPREPFEWYLDLRRFGSVPHSGFGMGVERTVAWICGIKHIRETIPFPRTLYRITP